MGFRRTQAGPSFADTVVRGYSGRHFRESPTTSSKPCLSFACKRFDGKVPALGPLDAEDRVLAKKVEAGFETVGRVSWPGRGKGSLDNRRQMGYVWLDGTCQ